MTQSPPPAAAAGRAAAKRARFAQLHIETSAFVLPNPWDAGGARLLAARGAQALATSSAAFAFTLGAPDGRIDRDAALAHAADIDRATDLPVSADLENGFGDAPEAVADTVRRAVDLGLAGCSIEDISDGRAYDADLATARIRAAVEAAADARAEGFQLTARADGVLTGAYDLEEALRRLKAFEAAGADVLYVPAPGDADALARVCAAVAKPVNALAAGAFLSLGRAEFERLGARRISLGSSLARLAHAAIDDAAREIYEMGGFSRMRGGAAGADIDALLDRGASKASPDGSP